MLFAAPSPWTPRSSSATFFQLPDVVIGVIRVTRTIRVTGAIGFNGFIRIIRAIGVIGGIKFINFIRVLGVIWIIRFIVFIEVIWVIRCCSNRKFNCCDNYAVDSNHVLAVIRERGYQGE